MQYKIQAIKRECNKIAQVNNLTKYEDISNRHQCTIVQLFFFSVIFFYKVTNKELSSNYLTLFYSIESVIINLFHLTEPRNSPLVDKVTQFSIRNGLVYLTQHFQCLLGLTSEIILIYIYLLNYFFVVVHVFQDWLCALVKYWRNSLNFPLLILLRLFCTEFVGQRNHWKFRKVFYMSYATKIFIYIYFK